MYEPKDSNDKSYEPEVDDYVVWERPNGGTDEGWVYFKGDPVDNDKRIKQGWNPVSQYITIETSVRPKPNHMYSSGKEMEHKMIHTLLLCNKDDCHELKFIKKRTDKECQHYSQYDDVHGNG